MTATEASREHCGAAEIVTFQKAENSKTTEFDTKGLGKKAKPIAVLIGTRSDRSPARVHRVRK
jgi:hypothetical protein